jgi:hypothetical protein
MLPCQRLREFFEKYNRPDVARYFSQVEIMNMVVPLMEVGERLKGTVTDGRLLSVFGSSGNIYAMGVIVNAGKDTFCVFVPGMESAIDTYFGFLRERPKSIAVKVTQWVQATASEKAWAGSDSKYMKLICPRTRQEKNLSIGVLLLSSAFFAYTSVVW